MRAGGGVVTFVPRGGVAAARRFADSLKLIPIATSLGGVETIVELPYDLDFGEAVEQGAELPFGGAIRMSVGLEDYADLWGDIDHALAQIQSGTHAHASADNAIAHDSPSRGAAKLPVL